MNHVDTTPYRFWAYPRGPPTIPTVIPSPLKETLETASQDLRQLAKQTSELTYNTRRSSDAAYKPWRDRWLTTFRGNESLIQQVVTWLAWASKCHEQELSKDVPVNDMVDLAISVFLLVEDGRRAEALEDLAMWQNHILSRRPFKQRSPLLEVASNIGALDSEDEDTTEDWEWQYLLWDSSGYSDSDDDSTDSHGSYDSDYLPGSPTDSDDDFEPDFDDSMDFVTDNTQDERSLAAIEVPTTEGGQEVPSRFRPRRHLQSWDLTFRNDATYETYLTQCQHWETSLRTVIYRKPVVPEGEKEEDLFSPSFQEAQSLLANTIQAIKKVPPAQYRTGSFSWAQKNSGLAQMLSRVVNPSFQFEEGSLNVPIFIRLHAFAETLAGVIDRWTPKEWSDEAVESLGEEQYQRVPSGGSHELTSLLGALCRFPDIIPRSSNPAFVYFALSENNFKTDWYRWLSWGLNSHGYIVQHVKPKQVYRMFVQEIRNLRSTVDPESGSSLYVLHDIPAPLRSILDHTIEYRRARARFRKHIREQCRATRWRNPVPCSTCGSLTDETRKCRREVIMPLNRDPNIRERYEHAGVSNAPKDKRMKPRQGGGRKNPTTIYTTEELGLSCLEPHEETLKECKQQVFYIREYEGGPLVDFVAFGVFAPEVLEEIASTIDLESGVKSVRRGSGKDRWNSGSMRCFGARVASGGRKADEYVYYAGIEADTVEEMEILFKHAKSSMYQLEVTKLLHPDLFEELRNTGKVCERVGEYGVNLFTCEGYTAPLHDDKDACRSICSQIRWDADASISEFGFCQLEYKYYIRTRANMLWSFDARKLHGTVLPSEDTLQVMRLRGGVSSGQHDSIRKKDAARAARRQAIRDNYHVRRRIYG
ncbi:hypothetical protein VNI00_017615 [Paramarasmius palmivorus]|uniref:Uncharacterized protein n=1 Tax=Paramarasmius palmivorus TaxID=297713 RepID=A0AAW0B535_9AGAR